MEGHNSTLQEVSRQRPNSTLRADKGQSSSDEPLAPGFVPKSASSESSSAPEIRHVCVRRNRQSYRGYTMVVPLRVKGHKLDGVIDTGAEVTVVNSKFINLDDFEAEPVVLSGLEKDQTIKGHLIRDVVINLGGMMFRFDLYAAPFSDDFLLGLDFMIAYNADPLVSRNTLRINGIEIPALFKRGLSEDQPLAETRNVKRIVVPPSSGMQIQLEVDKPFNNRDGMLSSCCKELWFPYVVAHPRDGKVVTNVINLTDRYVTLKRVK